ncbi:MAG: class I SAM-dependent methyltransferase, partial [Streptosporangiales bacterium]
SDVLSLVGDVAGRDVVEVGYGPGTLAQALLSRGAHVRGVDPSERMHAMARRRNAAAARDGRADLRIGDAESTGLADGCADLVVSANNVPMWPDLAAGLQEMRRLLRPGGRLVVSWHGGTQASRMARRFALPEHALGRIEEELRSALGNAERHDLAHVVAFTATR